MSLFVRVVTHYGSNESNDSLGVFSEEEISSVDSIGQEKIKKR